MVVTNPGLYADSQKGGCKGMRVRVHEVCHLGGMGGTENFSIFGALSLSLVQSEAKYNIMDFILTTFL